MVRVASMALWHEHDLSDLRGNRATGARAMHNGEPMLSVVLKLFASAAYTVVVLLHTGRRHAEATTEC